MISDWAIDVVLVVLPTLERLGRLRWRGPQLVRRVSKETDLSGAQQARIADARAVTRRVEPILKHPVRVLARVALIADAVAERRADYGGVGIPTRVAALSLLSAMRVGAVGPVVGTHSRAALDFVGVHPEVVRGEETIVMVMVEELLNRNRNRDELIELVPVKHFLDTNVITILIFYTTSTS